MSLGQSKTVSGQYLGQYILSQPIYIPHWKGELGESLVKHHYLSRRLGSQANWSSLTPKLGRQGIDLLYVKYNTFDKPSEVWVGEVKYGSSRLGHTKTGLQASPSWYKSHFKYLAKQYTNLSNGSVSAGRIRNARFQLPVKNGVFWKNDVNSPWRFSSKDHSEVAIKAAQRQAKDLGKFYHSCALGHCTLINRIYEVSKQPEIVKIKTNSGQMKHYKTGNDIVQITERDGRLLGAGLKQKHLAITKRSEIKVSRLWNSKKVVDELYRSIKRSNPHISRKEVQRLYQKDMGKPLQRLQSNFKTLQGGLFMVLSSLIVDMANTAYVSEKEVISQASLGILDMTTQLLLHSYISELLNLSAFSTNSLLVGGLVGSLVSLGMNAMFGGLDRKQVVTSLAVQAGVALSTSGLMSLVASYGVASTGTAIGSLSGAAATKATLAWWGGGSLASGGFGVTGGIVALSGLTLGIGMTIAFIGTWGMNKWEESDFRKFQMSVLNEVINQAPSK